MSKTVFFDIDTQIDFLYPAGALYAMGAESIVDRVTALNRHAALTGNLVISTTCAHAEDDPEFKDWPPHCVIGTTGQQKPAVTLLDRRIIIPNASCELAIGDAQQVLLEKKQLDCFTNVNLVKLLDTLGAERYVVYGVVTEICVKLAAWALLQLGKPLELVTDAVCSLDDRAAQQTIIEFTTRGGLLTTSEKVLTS